MTTSFEAQVAGRQALHSVPKSTDWASTVDDWLAAEMQDVARHVATAFAHNEET